MSSISGYPSVGLEDEGDRILRVAFARKRRTTLSEEAPYSRDKDEESKPAEHSPRAFERMRADSPTASSSSSDEDSDAETELKSILARNQTNRSAATVFQRISNPTERSFLLKPR